VVLAPFGEGPAGLPVLGGTLQEAQSAALVAAAPALAAAPTGTLVYGEHTWFTASLVERLVAHGRPCRLRVEEPDWLRLVAPLLRDPTRPTIGVVPDGAPPEALFDQPEVVIDGGFEPMKMALDHPAFATALADRMLSGLAVAHDVEHWAHLVRLNGIALAALGRERKASFDRLPWYRRLWMALGVLTRAGGLTEARLARALSRVGKRARVHPTAVVELCELGDDVEVGPHAVLRGVVAGPGARFEAMAHVTASSIGPRATVGRQAHVALCVLAEGAYVSAGVGHQATLFGRDSFVALGVCTFDLSFGKPIQVDTPEGRVSAGTHFLGSAIGHRAKLGAGVRLGYGVTVPNDAFLVSPAADVLRRWPEAIAGAATVREGVAAPVSGEGSR
jgi:acetyltransferase-like isoleucine patch superfamily enzyme